ncbi:MAG: HAD-IIB family hydrolase [Pseudomonadota bacterium]
MNRFLLCTDLDRTLIPNGIQPEAAGARERFKRLVSRTDVTLVYVTGRHRRLIEKAIADFQLPQPDFAIADVGSTIYRVDPSKWQQWDDWNAQIAPDWRGLSHDELNCLLSVFPLLHLQAKEKQNRHKLSFNVPLETDMQVLLGEMDTRLRRAGIKANLIWSIDEEAGLGLLDILPASANKLHAIRFLMQKNGFLLKDTIFAGDSGNDLDVLLSNIPSVLVANAEDQIKGRAANADMDTLYIAKGGYLGMNGNYCAGILEGAAHYWPEIDKILNEMDLPR